MAEELEFYFLKRALRAEGIVIGGELYISDLAATDASMHVQERTIPLRHVGSIENVIDVEMLVQAKDIRKYKQAAMDHAIQGIVSSTHNASRRALLTFEILNGLLPYLDEFDARVNSMPRSDLVALRRKEIMDLLGTTENTNLLLNREQVKASVAKKLDELCKVNESVLRMDFKPTYLVLDGASYALTPRKFRGDVAFSTASGQQLFKMSVGANPLGRLNDYLAHRIVHQVGGEFDREKLDDLLAFLNSKYCATNPGKELVNDFQYGSCGIRQFNGIEFVYVTPVGFAMHDIREGFTDRWYPFRNPPEVGVFVNSTKVDDTTRNTIYVNGDFEYIHFSSKKGEPKTFCGTDRNVIVKGNTWQERTINRIMHGVYTLFNGLDEGSLTRYENNGILGEAYLHPLSTLNWITEAEVEREGLLKTNLHPTVRATVQAGGQQNG